jgi:transcription antitermination protein NusB
MSQRKLESVQVRRKARSTALQVLYEIDSSEHRPDQVLNARLEDEPIGDDNAEEFLRNVVFGVLKHRDRLDLLIHDHAPEWPVDQMAIVDRNILRMAIFELAVRRDTPLKVAINEAVELAKLFGSDSAPRFINGVLGTLATKQNELIAAFHPDWHDGADETAST